MWDLPFVETATFWFGLGAVFFGVLTAALTVLAFVYQVRLGALKDEEYARFKDESRLGIVSAEARSDEAKERVLILEVESAKQQERAAKAEGDLLELRAKLGPRSIAPDIRKRLVDLLRSATPKGPVEIASPFGEAEAAEFAKMIRAVLVESGWDAGDAVVQDLITGTGVYVSAKDAAHPPQHAVTLQHVFKAAGMPLDGYQDIRIPADKVRILVASKPVEDISGNKASTASSSTSPR